VRRVRRAGRRRARRCSRRGRSWRVPEAGGLYVVYVSRPMTSRRRRRRRDLRALGGRDDRRLEFTRGSPARRRSIASPPRRRKGGCTTCARLRNLSPSARAIRPATVPGRGRTREPLSAPQGKSSSAGAETLVLCKRQNRLNSPRPVARPLLKESPCKTEQMAAEFEPVLYARALRLLRSPQERLDLVQEPSSAPCADTRASSPAPTSACGS